MQIEKLDPTHTSQDVEGEADSTADRADGGDEKANYQINWHNVMERAGAMGWTHEQFNRATMPEFIHFFRGWQRSKGIDPDATVKAANKPITKAEAKELFVKYG